MDTRKLAFGAFALWVLTVAAIAYLFVNGYTTEEDDRRAAIQLEPAERDLVLREMRTMLASVQGIVVGLADDDFPRIQQSARASGMAIAQDVPAPLMAKLPLDFKQLGMGVHEGFDQMAAAVEQEEPPELIMARLGDQLTRCVACHARYRISAPGPH